MVRIFTDGVLGAAGLPEKTLMLTNSLLTLGLFWYLCYWLYRCHARTTGQRMQGTNQRLIDPMRAFRVIVNKRLQRIEVTLRLLLVNFEQYRIKLPEAASQYLDSIHGHGLLKMGLIVAPSCNDCHGVHNIRRTVDRSSPIHHSNVAHTCGKCHVGIEEIYKQSVHGRLLARGEGKGPVCNDSGALGGIINALVSDNGFIRPREESLENVRILRPGFLGNMAANWCGCCLHILGALWRL